MQCSARPGESGREQESRRAAFVTDTNTGEKEAVRFGAISTASAAVTLLHVTWFHGFMLAENSKFSPVFSVVLQVLPVVLVRYPSYSSTSYRALKWSQQSRFKVVHQRLAMKSCCGGGGAQPCKVRWECVHVHAASRPYSAAARVPVSRDLPRDAQRDSSIIISILCHEQHT